MPKLSYMQSRERRSTLWSLGKIYGPRVTRPILHWEEPVCFDYFLQGREEGALNPKHKIQRQEMPR